MINFLYFKLQHIYISNIFQLLSLEENPLGVWISWLESILMLFLLGDFLIMLRGIDKEPLLFENTLGVWISWLESILMLFLLCDFLRMLWGIDKEQLLFENIVCFFGMPFFGGLKEMLSLFDCLDLLVKIILNFSYIIWVLSIVDFSWRLEFVSENKEKIGSKLGLGVNSVNGVAARMESLEISFWDCESFSSVFFNLSLSVFRQMMAFL